MLDRLEIQEAQDLLHHCLESGSVIPGRHFRDELVKEAVSMVDAWRLLKSGRIYNAPEFHTGSQEWNYRIEGNEPGGKWLVIVFSFKAVDTTFLVTVFSIESRKKITYPMDSRIAKAETEFPSREGRKK
jgi:hypothetical protein